MSQVIAKPVEPNQYGFRPFYWGSSVSVERTDGGTLTIDEALKAGGLDFTVEKFPLGAYTPRNGERPKFTTAQDMFVTARTDTGAILGAVGKRYVPYQFAEGAAFVSDIVDSGEAIIEVVGQSDNGRKGWIVCRLLGTGMKVGGVDEDITPYLTIIMDHAGNQAVTAMVSPVRPICSNLLNFAIKEASHVFRVRHTANSLRDKLTVTSGREALGLSVEYMGAFEREMKKLLERKVTDKQFENFLDKIVPVPKEAEDKAGKRNRGVTVAEEKQSGIRAVYYGDNLNDIRHTRYGVLQSVVEYYQHETQGRNTLGDDASEEDVERSIAEQRTNRLMQGVGLGQTAWDILTTAR